MPRIESTEITTLSKFIEIAEALDKDPEEPFWYRGIGDVNHKLSPSLYRHPTKRTADELLSLEKDLVIRFRQRSLPFLAAPLEQDWEYLFLMQHFGAPTRLLDWTENPLIALFFALVSAERDRTTGDYVSEAAVWVFSPALWNRHVFSHVSFGGSALPSSHKYLDTYGPTSTNPDRPPALPAAIFGSYNSPRIVAQRGVFTIFGSTVAPMEEIYENHAFADGALRKLTIPADRIAELLKTMLSMGITDSVVFPDLEGLARESKRLFGF